MLVIYRTPNYGGKPGADILNIGPITIQVMDVRGKQVKLAISAPPEFDITRPDCKKDKDGKVIDRGQA